MKEDHDTLLIWVCAVGIVNGRRIVVLASSPRHYLYGTKSVIYTDHKSLQHIFDQKELNMRHRRWIELFSDYCVLDSLSSLCGMRKRRYRVGLEGAGLSKENALMENHASGTLETTRKERGRE
ncbi:putative reverse transcriptase domain-containing protein [Tanacetum coccineum]